MPRALGPGPVGPVGPRTEPGGAVLAARDGAGAGAATGPAAGRGVCPSEGVVVAGPEPPALAPEGRLSGAFWAGRGTAGFLGGCRAATGIVGPAGWPLGPRGAGMPVVAAAACSLCSGRSQRPQYAEIAKFTNPQCGHAICDAALSPISSFMRPEGALPPLWLQFQPSRSISPFLLDCSPHFLRVPIRGG